MNKKREDKNVTKVEEKVLNRERKEKVRDKQRWAGV